MEQYRILSHPADNGGCGHYRMKYPVWATHTLQKNVNVVESIKLVPLPEFYADIRMVRIQRQLSNLQCKYVLEFLKPLSERYGFWLCYEIDDVVGRHDIPRYNSGWAPFQNDQLMHNMKLMLQAVDIITVTTQELANYYIKEFGADKNKIYVSPNYLPRWWIGDSYTEDRIAKKYDEMEKPRIGFVSSSTHFDLQNVNNGVDDFTHITDFIRDTVDDYEWVFVGGVPQQLLDLSKDKKIECHRGFDILNYPRMIGNLNLHTVVAPLQDNVFNRCKSNIKFLEMGALGIPCICQDLVTYRKYTNTRFKTADDLALQLDTILKSKEAYMDNIKHNRNIIENGDSNSPNGWWLEKNMEKWLRLFCINQRVMRFDLRKLDAHEAATKIQSPKVEEITFEV